MDIIHSLFGLFPMWVTYKRSIHVGNPRRFSLSVNALTLT